MNIIQHNPEQLYPRYKNFSHAIEVKSGTRQLFISGLNGYLQDGKTMPESFAEQGEIVWKYLGILLKEANMDYKNLVSIRTYLAKPEYDNENVALRVKYLGDHAPSLTVICCQLLDPKWKIELEAIAAE